MTASATIRAMPDHEKEDLGASFRQSRKELWFMLGTWVVFATWTLTYNGMNAFDPETSGEKILWGMPRWVALGIAVPWITGLCLTCWFALRFMKDTDLGGTEEELQSENGEAAE